MAMDSSPVLVEARGRILILTLNRPESGNTLDDAMAEALRHTCRVATESDECRVVVLIAAGATFCKGAWPSANTPDEILRRRTSDALAAIPKPVIAGVQGGALGQGLELALACDLRVAETSALFALDQVRHGLIPWDGGSQRLPRLVPRGFAMEMLLTGRRITAGEALKNGLISEVTAPGKLLDRVMALAGRMTELAPTASAFAKEAVLKGMDMPLGQGIRLETDLAVLLHSTKDRAEGIKSFLEKRQPRFTGE
jgi:enoyl-CoA hydratase/carnithine racemase